MQRSPYQEPQTAMERHIASLVDDLRYGKDSRSGFAQKIEAALDHAFWLEKEYRRLRDENYELEKKMWLPMPEISASWKAEPLPPEMPKIANVFWELRVHRWASYLKPFQTAADEKMWRRIRQTTFKELVKRIREQFEQTFPTRPFSEAADQ